MVLLDIYCELDDANMRRLYREADAFLTAFLREVLNVRTLRLGQPCITLLRVRLLRFALRLMQREQAYTGVCQDRGCECRDLIAEYAVPSIAGASL